MEHLFNLDQPSAKKSKTGNVQLDFTSPSQSLLNSLKIPRKDTQPISSYEDDAENSNPILPGNQTLRNQYFHCKECKLFLSSQLILDDHLRGAKHARKLQELGLKCVLKKLRNENVLKMNKNEFRCERCNVLFNSLLSVKSHIDGIRHKKKKMEIYQNVTEVYDSANKNSNSDGDKIVKNNLVQKIDGDGAKKLDNVSKKNKSRRNSFPCDICHLVMNSKSQYDEHAGSKKHLTKVAEQLDLQS